MDDLVIPEDISISEYFVTCWSFMSMLANVSDFEENEIRCLRPKNQTTLSKIKEWDGILLKNEVLREKDLGINKNREMFCVVNGNWKPIKN